MAESMDVVTDASPGAAHSMTAYYAEERKLNAPQAVKVSREARTKKALKTEVKLTTAFVKKVAAITDDTAAGLIKDVNEKLNLTRFVEEIVASIAKAPLKLKDVEGATALCSAMHRSYDEFMDLLYRSLTEQFDQACKSDDKQEVVRRRVLLRWFGELYAVGLLENDPQCIVKVVRAVTRAGSPSGPLPEPLPDIFPPLPDAAFVNMFAVNAFLKALGSDLVYPSPSADFPPPSIRSRLLALFTAYVKGSLARLEEERTALRRVRRRVDNESLKRGEVSPETLEILERREKLCDELYQGTVSLCDSLDVPKPLSPEELREQEESQKEAIDKEVAEKIGIELLNRKKGGVDADLSMEAWIFGDEATRSFYEDLDDLVAVIPRSILERPDQALQPEVIERLKEEKSVVAPASSETANSKAEGSNVDASGTAIDTDEIDNPDAIQPQDDENDDDAASSAPTTIKVESVVRPVEELMARLPNMLSERAVDNFARDFAHHNSKSARKRLVQELFLVPRNRTDLLPFYARLAATLSKVYVGIGRTLVDSVRSAFFGATRNTRPGRRLSARLRHAKYLGELVKFGLKCPQLECPPAAAFRALKQTIDIFQGENIDMACALVESCGRELYRTSRTHAEFEKLLEALQRLRTVKNLGPVHDALVDNAYYHCIPVESSSASTLARGKVKRSRSEIERYVRHLLIDKLGEDQENNANLSAVPNANANTGGKSTNLAANNSLKARSKLRKQQKDARTQQMIKHCSEVTNSLLRLPWNDNYEECEDAIARAFLASCKHRADTLPFVCEVVASVSKRYPRVQSRVADDLIETIIFGIDQNVFRHNQRRVGQAKCLGYMLRSMLVTMQTFFDILFMILHRGHEKPLHALGLQAGQELLRIPACVLNQAHLYHPAVPCASDPPHDAFRIRLVCAALEAAGDKVTTKAGFERLDVFVKYLERYAWNKSYMPIETEFYMLDTLQELERKALKKNEGKLSKGRGKHASSKRKAGGKKGGGAEDGAEVQKNPFQLVGRAPTRQLAEDQVSAIEGRGFQSILTVSTTIEEGDEEEEEDEDDDEDDEDEEEASEEDDDEEEEEEEVDEAISSTKKPSGPWASTFKKHEPTPEDLAFEAEFAKLMKETVEQSGKSNLGGSAIRGDNLVIPLNVLKKSQSQQQSSSAAASEQLVAGSNRPVSTSSPASGVTLQLLKRGPNRKVEVRSLVVPDDTLLAKASMAQEGARKGMMEEDEAIKRLTLKAAAATTTRMREAGDF